MIGMTRAAAVTPLLALLVTWHLAAAPDTGNNAQLTQLLSDAENQASLLKSDLGTVAFFASSANGWQSHSTIVAAYKDHIGAVRSLAAKLTASRAGAPPARRTAIDRLVPLMQDFAAAAETMIDVIGKNPDALSGSDYQQYVKLNSDLASEFSSLVSTWVQYARTGDDLARVAAKIGAPVPPAR